MAREFVQTRALALRSVVLGADDGIITTFAIIAGAEGAGLPSRIVVILGLAKLLADALSMAASVYLGTKSEAEFEKSKGNLHWRLDSPFKEGVTTFASFIVAGFMPLLPYLLRLESRFLFSSVILGFSLFALGFFKSINTNKHWIRSGLEMVLVGGGTAIVAYLVGYVAESYLI